MKRASLMERVSLAPSPIVGVRAAFVFLSRIPLGGFPYRDEDWRWAPAHFPFVGAVVGLGGALVLWLSAPLGHAIAAICSVISTVYMTGAFHEDGLADTADALGGSHGTQRLFEILKDSRIGTYGACALLLSLLLRVACLAELAASLSFCLVTTVVVHVLARVGPVWLMASLPYVSEQGAKGSSVAAGGSWSRAVVATSWGVAALVAARACGVQLILLGAWVLALLAVTLWLRRSFRLRAGGYTGDFLGATEQMLELALLLVAVGVEHQAPSVILGGVHG